MQHHSEEVSGWFQGAWTRGHILGDTEATQPASAPYQGSKWMSERKT